MAHVRTRFAPSPTGHLHIGNARTALFNSLFALQKSGSFILRIEDTDRERSKKEFESSIIEDLKWLGLEWDEGPDRVGSKGPYRQSERLGVYRDLAERLLGEGSAYRCYCSKERLEELKKNQLKAGLPPRYDGRCRELKARPEGIVPAVRFRVIARKVAFKDGVHGDVSFDTSAFGDFVLIGSDGIASYNFAAVVDDALMEITDIIRGEDHLPNTPRQILLFESLGFKAPSFSHIPLVLSPRRVPLSKRDPSSSLKELKEKGYTPEAVVNTIARLGWHPGEDLLSIKELTELFRIEDLSKSPSIFDMDRLKSYNKLSIGRSGTIRLLNLLSDSIKGLLADPEEAIETVRANAETLRDFEALLAPFRPQFPVTEEASAALKEPHAKPVISAFLEETEQAEKLDAEWYRSSIESVKRKTGEKGKRLFMPIRAALTGRTEGIELAGILKLLGKGNAIKRLKDAVK